MENWGLTMVQEIGCASGTTEDIEGAKSAGVMTMVLAGGEGRRLWPLTRDCCKPALPFADNHRTIDFTLANSLNSGLHRVAVLAQYEAASLSSYLEYQWRAKAQRAGTLLETWLSGTGPRAGYRGTANAVAQNLSRQDVRTCRRVLILAGDHIYRMDYRALLADHVARGADITVACVEVPQSEAQSYGVVAVDQYERIIRFEEKPAQPAIIPGCPGRSFVSMGIYLFETEVLMECLREDVLDFGRDVLPRGLTRAGVFAHRFRDAVQPESNYWRDVGTIGAGRWARQPARTRACERHEQRGMAWSDQVSRQQPKSSNRSYHRVRKSRKARAFAIASSCRAHVSAPAVT